MVYERTQATFKTDKDGNPINVATKENQGKVLAGISRMGNVTITRNGSDYITSIVIVENGTTRTITVGRNGNNYITSLTEAIT